MATSTTLTPQEILTDVMDAFKVSVPMLFDWSTSFSNRDGTPRRGYLNQKVTAHIQTRPTVATYDATNGYKNGAVDARGLLIDVDVTLSNHKHVPLKLDHLNVIADKKEAYQKQIALCAWELGKEVVDSALDLVTSNNFSQVYVESVANTDRDTLGGIRKLLNTNGASPSGRIGIVNSDIAEELDADTRIASRDYYGQQTGGSAYLNLKSVAGFQSIYEYPDLPANAENLTGFFCDPRAICVATALPNHGDDVAAMFGIPRAGKFIPMTDPETGLSLLGIMWEDPGTFDIYLTVALLWGVAGGKQGVAENSGSRTDYAGVRLISSSVS